MIHRPQQGVCVLALKRHLVSDPDNYSRRFHLYLLTYKIKSAPCSMEDQIPSNLHSNINYHLHKVHQEDLIAVLSKQPSSHAPPTHPPNPNNHY